MLTKTVQSSDMPVVFIRSDVLHKQVHNEWYLHVNGMWSLFWKHIYGATQLSQFTSRNW